MLAQAFEQEISAPEKAEKDWIILYGCKTSNGKVNLVIDGHIKMSHDEALYRCKLLDTDRVIGLGIRSSDGAETEMVRPELIVDSSATLLDGEVVY